MARSLLRRPLMTCAAACLTLSACIEPEVYSAPSFAFQSDYQGNPQGAPVLLTNSAWWEGLHDPVLNRLVALALRDNPSLELARERVITATASRDSIGGPFSLTSSARVQALGTDRSGGPDVVGQTDLGLNWILDPYGARASELAAAQGRIEVADAELDAARLLLLSNLTNAYVELRYNQELLALTRHELANRQETLRITRALAEAEASTRLEIVRSEARVAELRSRLPGRQAAITSSLHQIANLLGTTAGRLPPDLMGQLEHGSGQPAARLSPDVGIPADLLRNRPDLVIAERSYYAAVAEIGVARASLYPRLSLGGAISVNALAGGGRPSTEYYLGPLVQLPTLPLASGQAAVEERQSIARQAHSTWTITVLNALLEVENALLDYQSASTAMGSAQEASRLYSEAMTLTREVFTLGEATLGDLIDAEQGLAQANRNLADLRLLHAQRFIALNVSLGAGHAAPAQETTLALQN